MRLPIAHIHLPSYALYLTHVECTRCNQITSNVNFRIIAQILWSNNLIIEFNICMKTSHGCVLANVVSSFRCRRCLIKSWAQSSKPSCHILSDFLHGNWRPVLSKYAYTFFFSSSSKFYEYFVRLATGI